MAEISLVSATSLANALGIAVKNTGVLLDQFRHAGIAVEVTHRSKRRLYGLTGLAPLRNATAPPYRPQPGRGRGRPPRLPGEVETPPPLPLVLLTPSKRREFDTSGLEEAIACAEAVISRTRHQLDRLRGRSTNAGAGGRERARAYGNEGRWAG